MKNIILFILSLFIFFNSNNLHSTETETLTQEEKEYLLNKKVLKTHIDKDWKPYAYMENGIAKGYIADLQKLVANKLGLDLSISDDNWSDDFNKLKSNQIDLMFEITKTKERENYFLFSKLPIQSEYYSFVSFENLDSIEKLDNKKIAVEKGTIHSKNLKKYIPNAKIIEYDNNDNYIEDLLNGKIDAIYKDFTDANYQISSLNIGKKIYINVLTFDKKLNKNHIATNKSNTILMNIIDKTLSKNDILELQNKWGLKVFDNETNLDLSNEEKEYLNTNPIIKYSEVNWKPLSIIENNQMNGIMGDYLKLVAKKTGLTFEFIPSKSWPDVLENFKNGKIDLVPGIGTSPQETNLGLVSKTYAKFPMAIVTSGKYNFIGNLNNLEGKTIAVPKYYTSYNFLVKNYPKIKLKTTNSISEALKSVQNGDADAFVGHITTSLFYISDMHLHNLKISGQTSFTFEHKYLIQNNNPILLSIINKAFDSITDLEKKEIHNKWIDATISESYVDYTLFWQIFIPLLIFISIIIYLYLKQREQNRLIQKLNAKNKYQKDKYKNFLKFSSEGVVVICPEDAKVVEHSYEAEKMLGYSKKEFKNLHVYDFDKDIKDFEEFKTVALSTIDNETIEFERIHTRKDGSTYNVLIKQSKIYINDELYLYAIFRDITEKKILEQRLKDINENLEQIIKDKTKKLNHSLEIIETHVIGSQTDLDGVITKVTDKFCEISKYSKDEIIGKKHNIVRHEDNPDLFYVDLWETIKSGKTWKGRIKNKNKDGEAYWVDSIISALYDENDVHIGYYSYRIDVTDEVMNNELHNRYTNELESRVKEQLEDIRQKDKKLNEQLKLASMGEMMQNIAHQWRQPLNAISINAQGIEFALDYDLYEKEEIKENIKNISDSCKYLSETIEVFSNYMNKDKIYKLCSIENEIEHSKRIVEPSLKVEEIKIIDEINYSNLHNIQMVEYELSQVLINLLNNSKDAFKSNPDIKDRWIKISDYEKNDCLVIMIEDNAGGIPEDIISRIFEPYFTTKFKSQGTGLGLSMSHNIIKESFNGEIHVQNTGNGAKFYLEIPLKN